MKEKQRSCDGREGAQRLVFRLNKPKMTGTHSARARRGAKTKKYCTVTSVADPGCLSRILIFTHPGSRIQKQQQKRGVKKNLLSLTFFVATNFTKLHIILVLMC
jgi:hypothetical protein